MKQSDKLGLIGIICSVVGFFIFGLPLNIAALILGIMGVKEEKTALPIISLIVGAIFVALYVLVFILAMFNIEILENIIQTTV